MEGFDRLTAVRRLTHDLEVGLGVDDHLEAAPHEGLVIDQQNPHFH